MAQPTQNFIPIKEIRNGMIVLKDNTLRAIIMCSSINLALKSDEEISATIFQFQSLLNSLDFSIQIYVQSRRLDIRPYIALLKEREAVQTNELLRAQTKAYIDYITMFTSNRNIMSKSFFIVVPYQRAIISTSKGPSGVFGSEAKAKPETDEHNDSLDMAINQLEQRLLVVEQGLSRTGVRTMRLGSEELIELYYKIFNPTEATDAV